MDLINGFRFMLSIVTKLTHAEITDFFNPLLKCNEMILGAKK
jgi:hypothetical protein